MGLNLSRGPATKYYSSDRVAQLFGNGLLTFINKITQFDDFLPKNTFISYQDIDDLSFKINKYKKDDKERKKIAKICRYSVVIVWLRCFISFILMLCVVVSIIDFCFHFIIQPVITSGDEFTIEFPGSNNWCKVYHCDALDMA